ncbi:MAG: NAD(+) diphosphatase [Gammaproteobacteria bacterium]
MMYQDDLVFIFYQDDLLMISDRLPKRNDIDPACFALSQFLINPTLAIFAAHHPNASAPAGYDWIPLRVALTHLNDSERTMTLKARSLLRWERMHQYCGQCGQKTEVRSQDFSKYCATCNEYFYPRLAPSVIVLVHRGNEILLGRKSTFGPGIYSCLAGFIEPGETAEMTVHREIFEEANVTVSDLEYVGSQSWPFPESFMLGFFAKYQSGTLKIDTNELEDAQWFNINALPKMPTQASIAYDLIKTYVEQQR